MHRRHVAAQTSQCAWFAACRAHSLAHASHAAAHSCSVMLTTGRSGSNCRLRMRDAAVHRSTQSRLRRMARRSVWESSATQASAHAVHTCAHSTHAWIQAHSGSAAANGGSGLVRSIRSTVRCMGGLLGARRCIGCAPARASALSTENCGQDGFAETRTGIRACGLHVAVEQHAEPLAGMPGHLVRSCDGRCQACVRSHRCEHGDHAIGADDAFGP
jgi:hypothetical protein